MVARHSMAVWRRAVCGAVVLAACAASAGDAPRALPDDVTFAPVSVATRASPWFLSRDVERYAQRGALRRASMTTTTPRPAAPRSVSGEQRLLPVTNGDGGVADQFGTALASDGDRLVVGAMQDLLVRSDTVFGARSGSVSVYRLVDGAAQFEARLEPPDEQNNALFGVSVAIAGDVIVVGAPRATTDNAVDRGAAYVYVRDGDAWTLRARLIAPVLAIEAFFGWSVAISGDRIAIGAPRHDVPTATDIGAAYVFDRDGAGWSLSAVLSPADALAGDRFGEAISLAGDTLLVGAIGRDGTTFPDVGRAHVFARGDGSWPQVGVLAAPTPAVGALFGTSVLLRDDFAYVGAPGDTVGANAGQGAVYAFPRTGNAFGAPVRIVASNGDDGESFGRRVAQAGTRLLVGAPNYLRVQGAGYVFVQQGGAFVEEALLTHPLDGAQDILGGAVALTGDHAFLGANIDDVDPNRAQGLVRRYDFAGGAWPEAARIDTGDGAAEELFGQAVAIDGRTLVSGAFLEDPGIDLQDAGTAAVYERVAGAWQRVARLVAPDALAEDQFGFAVAVRGDWLAVGAPQAIINAQFNRGAVYLYHRVDGIWQFAQKLTTTTGRVDDAFGYALAFDETGTRLVASLPGDDRQAVDAGAALVYVLQGAQWRLLQRVEGPRGIVGALTGLRVAIGSRLLALGAPDDDTLGQNTGRVHLYAWQGSSYVFAQTQESVQRVQNEFFGNALAIDGVRVAIGAPGRSGTDFLVQHGAAFVIDDGRDTTFPLREIAPPELQDGGFFGGGVALRGDRLVVGAAGTDGPGGVSEGAAYLYRIDAATITLDETLRAADGRAFAFYGDPVELSLDALAIGAPGRGVDNPREGAVYAYRDDEVLFADGVE